jgi:hypothetical protein
MVRVATQSPSSKSHRFAFAPDKITLNQGQTVTLRLHSEETPVFSLRPWKIDEEIPAGQTIDVTAAPQIAGTFLTISLSVERITAT